MKDTLGYLLSSGRLSKKKSQEYMAMELGVARKTIQNWEMDKTAPTIDQAIKYFKVLGLSPVSFLFRYVFPENESLDYDDRYKTELKQLLEMMPPEISKQILHIFYGNHGSSPRAIMQLVIAHLETPMKDRITSANIVLKNYELAKLKNTTLNQCELDLDLLKDAINEGEESFVKGNEGYALERKK